MAPSIAQDRNSCCRLLLASDSRLGPAGRFSYDTAGRPASAARSVVSVLALLFRVPSRGAGEETADDDDQAFLQQAGGTRCRDLCEVESGVGREEAADEPSEELGEWIREGRGVVSRPVEWWGACCGRVGWCGMPVQSGGCEGLEVELVSLSRRSYEVRSRGEPVSEIMRSEKVRDMGRTTVGERCGTMSGV